MLYIRLSLLGLLLLCVHTWAQAPTFDVLLIAGDDQALDKTGIVVVTYAGINKTVCSEAFDNNDATVVCRDLGFDGFGMALDPGRYAGNLPSNLYDQYWLTQLACTGDEMVVSSCSYVPLGTGLDNCEREAGDGRPNDNYASVACLGNPITTTTTTTTTTTVKTTTTPETVCENPDPDIRLVDINGDQHPYEGRVQVRKNGQWYEICDDRWGLDDAKVVARMLCYNSNNARAHSGGYRFGNRTAGSYYWNDMDCTGSEQNLDDCESSRSVSDCSIQESAGVSVQDPAQPDLSVPVSVVVCDGAVETIHVSFPKSENPNLQPSHLSLTNESVPADCYTVGENSTEVYISIPFISCGTVRDFTNDSYIIYKNRITHYITTTNTITRRQAYIIDVICLMGRNGDPENEVQPDVVTLPPQYGKGEPILEINIYRTSAFSEKVAQLPAQFHLNERVHVAMELITGDPELKVILQQCYATPDESADSTPQYFLILDKCATDNTVNLYPISDTMFGFSFVIFTFTGVEHNLLYLHCKGIVCGLDEKYPRCDQTCGTGTGGRGSGRRRRSADDNYSDFQLSALLDFSSQRMRRQADFEPVEIDVDSGPIYILPPDEPRLTSTLLPFSQSVTTQPGNQMTIASTTNSTARPGIVNTDRTDRPGVPSTDSPARDGTTYHPQPTDQTTQRRGPVLVQDYPMASTATLIQITLSLLVSIAMALILT